MNMNKITHWSIARLSIINLEASTPEHSVGRLNKILFYIGAIEPDLSLFQLIHPHFYDRSANYIFSKIEKLYEKNNNLMESYLLGNLVHYLCDFCCYAHRRGMGRITDHFIYERRINKYLIKNYKDYKHLSYTKLDMTKPMELIQYIDATLYSIEK